LYSEKLYKLYCSPNIIIQINSRTMRWVDTWNSWKRRSVYRVYGFAWRKETTLKTKA
jgi:hypothetical protein